MTQELSTEVSPEIINSLILTGDMSKLTASQQTQYYTAVCKSVGINPITQPFAIITLQGKKTLYATKGCTQQLADSRKINTEIKKTETLDGVYVSSCRATMPDGRYTDDIGAVSIVGIKGAELANAMMKSITKAKRRAVLALCGLGMPDESEVEDIHPASEVKQDPTKSRVENIIDAHIQEVKQDATKDSPKEESAIKETAAKETAKETKTEEPKPKEDKKTTKASTNANSGVFTLPETNKIVIGLIEEIPKTGTFEKDGVPTQKWSFKIGNLRYGTFDSKLADKIMETINAKITVKFEFKERKTPEGKILNDIVKFSQAEADRDIPI